MQSMPPPPPPLLPSLAPQLLSPLSMKPALGLYSSYKHAGMPSSMPSSAHPTSAAKDGSGASGSSGGASGSSGGASGEQQLTFTMGQLQQLQQLIAGGPPLQPLQASNPLMRLMQVRVSAMVHLPATQDVPMGGPVMTCMHATLCCAQKKQAEVNKPTTAPTTAQPAPPKGDDGKKKKKKDNAKAAAAVSADGQGSDADEDDPQQASADVPCGSACFRP